VMLVSTHVLLDTTRPIGGLDDDDATRSDPSAEADPHAVTA
jgi:hypothetical protein